jgi:hypothetical protein
VNQIRFDLKEKHVDTRISLQIRQLPLQHPNLAIGGSDRSCGSRVFSYFAKVTRHDVVIMKNGAILVER